MTTPHRTPYAPTKEKRGWAGVFGWGGFALLALMGLTSGVGGVLMMAGLFFFVVAIVALIRGRVRWALLRGRSVAAGALVASLAAMGAGVEIAPAPTSTSPARAGGAAGPQRTGAEAAAVPTAATSTPSTTATPTPTTTSSTTSALTTTSAAPTPTRGTTATSTGAPGTALAVLGTLAVKGRAPMTGYDRKNFGAAWTDIDRNGCDQRNDTLRRDLKSITLKPNTRGCTVMTGILNDPYSGTTVSFARSSSSYSPVQIDHVVALANAWVMGAQKWDAGKRVQFANDSLNLLAVYGPANASKGAGDAATWLPANKSFRCSYVARQVAVKAKYGLAVTSAEKTAIARILGACPTMKLPTAGVAKLGGFPLYAGSTSKSTPTPSKTTTKPKPKPSSTGGSGRIVHQGAFCSPVGATGYTINGTPMRCSLKAGDPRARWRSAA